MICPGVAQCHCFDMLTPVFDCVLVFFIVCYHVVLLFD